MPQPRDSAKKNSAPNRGRLPPDTIAAHAVWREARLEIRAAVGDPERLDQPLLRAESAGEAADAAAAEALGTRVAKALLGQGAAAYLAAGASAEPSPAGS